MHATPTTAAFGVLALVLLVAAAYSARNSEPGDDAEVAFARLCTVVILLCAGRILWVVLT